MAVLQRSGEQAAGSTHGRPVGLRGERTWILGWRLLRKHVQCLRDQGERSQERRPRVLRARLRERSAELGPYTL